MVRFEEIKVADLIPHEHNVRRELRDMDDLTDSVKAKGVVQALTVAPHPSKSKKFVVLSGHRRRQAAINAKQKTVPCMVQDELDTDAAQLEHMLVENTQRNDLTPLEEADAYQTLLDLPDYDVKRIAGNTGRTQRLVKDRLKLVKLNPETRAKLDAGQMTIERALVVAEFSDDETASTQLEDASGANEASWDVKVKQLQKRREWLRKMPELREELERVGVEIVERPSGEFYEWGDLHNLRFLYGSSNTIEEHAKAGNKAIIDSGPMPYGMEPGIMWLRPVNISTAPVAEVVDPEIEAAQQEARAKHDRIAAGLDLAAQTRAEHLQRMVKNPPKGAAQKALADLVSTYCDLGECAELLGINHEQVDEQEVIDEIASLSLEQLAVLHHMEKRSAETWATNLYQWNPDNYMWENRLGPWIETVQDIYGYELSDLEREAIAHWAPADDAEGGDPDGED